MPSGHARVLKQKQKALLILLEKKIQFRILKKESKIVAFLNNTQLLRMFIIVQKGNLDL